MSPAETSVMRRAAHQLGLFTAADAAAATWSPDQIHRRMCEGEVRRVQPGVFAFTAAPATWEQQLLAATLAARAGAAASNDSAAIVHGYPDWWDDGPKPLHVAVPVGRQPRLHRVRLHRVQLHPGDIVRRRGIPCTSYERTLVDCSGMASLGQIARALDHGLVTNAVTLRSTARCALSLRPAPGRRLSVLRTLLRERAPGSDLAESRPEIRILSALEGSGLPMPTPQFWVTAGGERFRLDAAYPTLRIGLEYLGFDVHRSRSAFDRDHRRDRLLTHEGWTILYFTSVCTNADIVTDVARLLRSPR